MAAIFSLLTLVAFLVTLVCGLMLLVRAFQESAGQGLLCLFVPFYIFYWAFSRMSQGNQQLVATWLISAGVGWVSAFLMGASA